MLFFKKVMQGWLRVRSLRSRGILADAVGSFSEPTLDAYAT